MSLGWLCFDNGQIGFPKLGEGFTLFGLIVWSGCLCLTPRSHFSSVLALLILHCTSHKGSSSFEELAEFRVSRAMFFALSVDISNYVNATAN